jgi:choline dehydrogenase-like flavoprotein
MAMTPPEEAFKAKLEAAYPTRRLIIGRCAHLTETRPHHEELGRSACQYRSLCERGCSYGAYFSSLSATLPAAQKTGNLTVVTDAIAHSIVYDPKTGRTSGVRIVDAKTSEGRTYEGRIIFLCASTLGSAQVLLNSVSEAFPNGLANSSDAVGRYLIDHISGTGGTGTFPGYEGFYHRGRRPNGFYIPRYRNVTEAAEGYQRGYGFQGGVIRDTWRRGIGQPGVGEEYKASLRGPGPWKMRLSGFGEMLPRADNRVTLDRSKTDKWGIPIPHIACTLSQNELNMIAAINADAKAMLELAGCTDIQMREHYGGTGLGIHEMGTARMGKDPRTSVLNGFSQAHDVPNLFVTDGSAMASSGCQNPSLTYMAMSARAAYHAAEFMKAGKI